MLNNHIKNNADCTIAVLEVPMEEASRFGIMNTDENNVITEFEEKPKNPKSNKASMGIYIFKKDKLFKYLREDALDPNSQNDFGKNIIPTMLAKGEKMVAYPFKGYWKDVGTIKSLWEANQDLIGDNPAFDIYNPFWKIHSRNVGIEPQYIDKGAVIKNSIITDGAKISGTVINSIIGSNVEIAKGAVVKDSVIFAETKILEDAVVNYSIIDEKVIVGKGAKVGSEIADKVEIAVIGRELKIEDYAIVKAGANIEHDVIRKKEDK